MSLVKALIIIFIERPRVNAELEGALDCKINIF